MSALQAEELGEAAPGQWKPEGGTLARPHRLLVERVAAACSPPPQPSLQCLALALLNKWRYMAIKYGDFFETSTSP